ncbi:hypothetical protein HK096_003560 [Nowakowskiella sp. JEL0078]|nr:hypothetical protein HK096_003560 [Nowakowskiella sp. JEL0078]
MSTFRYKDFLAITTLILIPFIAFITSSAGSNPQVTLILSLKQFFAIVPHTTDEIGLFYNSVWKGVAESDRGVLVANTTLQGLQDGRWWGLKCEYVSQFFKFGDEDSEKSVLLQLRIFTGGKGCSNKCGRHVKDSFISPDESGQLIGVLEKSMSYSNGIGRVTFDLISGIASFKENQVDVYNAVSEKHIADPSSPKALLTRDEAMLVATVLARMRGHISKLFKAEVAVSRPFFSRIQANNHNETLDGDDYFDYHIDKYYI